MQVHTDIRVRMVVTSMYVRTYVERKSTTKGETSDTVVMQEAGEQPCFQHPLVHYQRARLVASRFN